MAHKALRRPADLRAIDGAFSGSIDTARLVALRVRSMPEPDRSRPIRSAPEAPERSHASRVHLQNLDNPWIMMRSATDLSKADLHVFSKLFDDGLERGQEAEAFSWRQIGGHDDVLDFFVGHLINVGMTRQPAP